MHINDSPITIDGNHLLIADLVRLTRHADVRVAIAPNALARVDKGKSFLDEEAGKKIIYGINTGFGPMASHVISIDALASLQRNLVISHAVGMGEPIPSAYVLAAMCARLNTLAKGYSGVSRKLLQHLADLINRRIIPIVPEHGAVGTSGDLVQLAHIALAIIGEGDVWYQGKRRKTAEVFAETGIEPYSLQAKEGLALINGTAMMTAITALLCDEATRVLDIAVSNGALALELVGAFRDGIGEKLHALRPHPGQVAVARKLCDILASSRLLQERKTFQHHVKPSQTNHEIPEDVQEVYSLRCIPQILGPVHDTLAHTIRTVEIELNAAGDNPLIDWEERTFLHGGNFHGDYVATAVDQLKMTLVKLTMLTERRTNYFLSHHINKRFPPFVNLHTPGLTLALQGLQFVATSTTAQSQTFAFPHSIHSIPTNADNQDVVSMGTDAALFAAKVIDNAFIVLAIELITLTQVIDYLLRKKQTRMEDYAQHSQMLYQTTRSRFPQIEDDRVIIDELLAMTEFLKHDALFADLLGNHSPVADAAEGKHGADEKTSRPSEFSAD